MSAPTWLTIAGWLEVVDEASGTPMCLNVAYISAITPSVVADHTHLVAAGSAGKTEIEVAEPYSSILARLQRVLQPPIILENRP